MRKIHCIFLGNSGTILIYMPSSDSLYEAYVKIGQFKSLPYYKVRLFGSLIFLAILLIYQYTNILKIFFNFNVYQCLMLSVIIAAWYRYAVLLKKATLLLKDAVKQIDIKYNKVLWNRLYVTTADTAIVLTLAIITAVVGWVNIDKFMISKGEEYILEKSLLLLLFCFVGYLAGKSDLMGRIKLLFRLYKEKRTFRK